MRSLAALASASSFSRGTRSILFRTRIFSCSTAATLVRIAVGLLVESRLGVEQHADEVGVMRPAPGGRDHGAVEPALRREDAGRVDQDDLRVVLRSTMPRISARVVCTLRETMVTLEPTSALTSVDLPTLGAPISATKPQRVRLRSPAVQSLLPPPTPSRSIIDGCRDLLGGALAAADAFGRRQPRQIDRDAELRIVMRAGALDLAIDRRRQSLALRPFLQHGLGIAQRPPRLAASARSSCARRTRSAAA